MKIILPILLFSSLLFLTNCQPNTYEQGLELYTDNCSQCHGLKGEGLNKLIPPISNSDYYKNNQGKIACIIKNGIKDTIKVNDIYFSENMAGIPKLNDVEICNIINFINTSFFTKLEVVSLQDVNKSLSKCK